MRSIARGKLVHDSVPTGADFFFAMSLARVFFATITRKRSKSVSVAFFAFAAIFLPQPDLLQASMSKTPNPLAFRRLQRQNPACRRFTLQIRNRNAV